eukprot:m.71290 g.71290  ORF g.71290 m.71290 type:complete len:53 (+) comp18616_c0_seq3:223-381(+)
MFQQMHAPFLAARLQQLRSLFSACAHAKAVHKLCNSAALTSECPPTPTVRIL